jgi:cytochrome c oxidase assembly protein subunit 15
MEFGNRLVTGLVSVAVVLAVCGALVRVRRRRDLTALSLGLVAGLLAEIVLGGLTVEHHLAPHFVTAHFLLAVVFLADAVVLHHRAGLPEEPVPGRPGRARPTGPAVPLVSPVLRRAGWVLVAAAAVVLCLGTVVTSTGPHAGAPGVPRYSLSLHRVAQLHGSSAECFLALSVATLWLLVRTGAPRVVLRRAQVLLGAVVVQGAIGYTQYFLGDPAEIVAFHEMGAVVLVVAVLHFALGLSVRPEPDVWVDEPVPAGPLAAAVVVG